MTVLIQLEFAPELFGGGDQGELLRPLGAPAE